MQRKIKIIGLIFLGVLLVIQFIRPTKNQSGYQEVAFFENETKPTAQIKSILRANCYDCHSNQTTYPWYAEVAPVSFWINHHVEEGKEHLNFADWSSYSVKRKDHKLEEFIEEVEEDHMPLDSYTWLHGSLSDEEKKLLLDWIKNSRKKYATQ